MSKNKNESKGAPGVVLNGSDTLPAEIELAEGKTISLGDLVGQANAASGLSAEDWNKLEAARRDELLQARIDALKVAADAGAGAPGGDGTTSPPDLPPAPAAVVKARVLSAFREHQPNDVVELTADEAAGLTDYVDTSPEAVAYAEQIQVGAES